MNLILFGFKASGKTHFGKCLSQELRRPFIDTDYLIEAAKKLPCREIALRLGEAEFRALESEVLRDLRSIDGAVIAVGGGTVLQPENLILLETLGRLVYLSAPKKLIKQRMLCPPLPSYLDPSDPEGSFERMYAHRKPLYEKIPALRIEI